MEKSAIMTRAHEKTRKTLRRYPGADYAATLGSALEIAWEENGRSALERWQDMSADEQERMVSAFVGYEYRRREARVYGGKLLPNVFSWVTDPARDLEEVKQEAFCRILERLAAQPDTERPLERLVDYAVITAAQAIYRQTRRNASALRQRPAEDGADAAAALDYVIDNAAPLAERIAPNPEEAACIRDAIDRAAADDKDREIIRLLGAGFTQAEIASRAGMSQPAVAKRIARLRERYNRADA